MRSLNSDMQIGKGAEQRPVIVAHGAVSGVMLVPRLVVVRRFGAESAHDPVEVVGVLASDVLFDELQSIHDRQSKLSPAAQSRHGFASSASK